MYNFHKVRGDRQDCEFEHEKFKQDRRDLLPSIKRKISESFILSTNNIEELALNGSGHEDTDELKKKNEGLKEAKMREYSEFKDTTLDLVNLRL